MGQFITPESTPGSAVCFSIYVPDDDLMIAALFGCLTALEESRNWIDPFGISPSVAAAAWQTANENSFLLTECGGGVTVTLPIGSVMPTAGSTLPDGCLWCDGSYYDPESYPDLYAEIGYTWGQNGDQFKVPNLIDTYLKGAGYEDSLGDHVGSNNDRAVPLLEHTHQIYKTAGAGATADTITPGTKTAGATMDTLAAGDSSPVIDIEPRRAVFNFYIVAEAA
jgi:microcystin-dependent protein